MGSRTIYGGAWRLKKAKNLVKLLALSRGHRLHRERVLDEFWPDLDVKAASNNWHRVLHSARKSLGGDLEHPDSRYLRLEGDMVVLCQGRPLWVDVEAFE